MSSPTKYHRGFSFSDYQATNPSQPLPGPSVDNELENVEQSVNETIDALADLRRSDGKLNNGIVTPEALAPGLNMGFTVRGVWQPNKQYFVGDVVGYSAITYRANATHVSVAGQTPDVQTTLWTVLDATTTIGPMATQAEAEAGARNDVFMSPLRTKQHVDARIGTAQGQIVAFAAGGELPVGLDKLPDVDLTTTPPAVGNGLVWDGTKYVPGPAGGGMFRGNNGTVGNRSGDIFRVGAQTLTADVTIAGTENAQATGPLTIQTGVTLTVASGGTLVIL